jgi:hypothetical protein
LEVYNPKSLLNVVLDVFDRNVIREDNVMESTECVQ